MDCVDGLVLGPCCMSGSLGAYAKFSVRAPGSPNYGVLVETLASVAWRELASNERVTAMFDHDALSPVNGIIALAKADGRAAGPSS